MCEEIVRKETVCEETVRERVGVQEGQVVMPFYLVCDVSASMTYDMPALNEGIRKLRRAIVAQPQVDDIAQIGIITFSDYAQVALPLSQLSEGSMPSLRAQNSTNYGSAFRLLAQTVEKDIAALKARRLRVYRPCAFFLTDGEPTDSSWFQTFQSTLTYDKVARTGMKGHPVFIPFGFRDAREDVLSKLAYPPERGKWFHTRTHNIEEALTGILDVIMTSVISSGLSGGAGKPMLALQTPGPATGITSGGSQYDSEWA
jgi:uncharacterized protein YegL